MQKSNKSSGFTLIEMMISIFLSSLVILLLIKVFDYHGKLALKMHYQNRVSQRAMDVDAMFRELFSFMLFKPICPYEKIISPQDYFHNINIYKGVEVQSLDIKNPQLSRQNVKFKSEDYRIITTLKQSDILVVNYLMPVDEKSFDEANIHRYLLSDCYDESYDKNDFQSIDDVSFYEEKTAVIYSVYERGAYSLVFNFGDGSNFYRIPDIALLQIEIDKRELLVKVLVDSRNPFINESFTIDNFKVFKSIADYSKYYEFSIRMFNQ